MKVNLTKAAQLVKLSRSYFYIKYVKTGKISIEKDDKGKPVVDTSELLRVFGNITDRTVSREHQITPNITVKKEEITPFEAELSVAKNQIEELKNDKKWLQEKINQLTDQLSSTTKLLEYKEAQPKKKRWWFF